MPNYGWLDNLGKKMKNLKIYPFYSKYILLISGDFCEKNSEKYSVPTNITATVSHIILILKLENENKKASLNHLLKALF